MTWKYTDKDYTDYTRSTWNEAASAYVDWSRNLAPYRADVIQAVRPRTNERFLDLATGPGEPALTIARRVGPGGQAVGVDISREMISIARRTARAEGLTHAKFLTMDCTRLSFPAAKFDAVVSCFGFQIFSDPEVVAHEAHRVLRPGGRIAASIWGPGEKTAVLDAIMGPMLQHAEPDESGYLPSPYELGGPGQLSEFFRNAGFERPRERRVSHVSHYRDAADYLCSIKRSTPIGHSLSEESAKVQAEVERETRRNLRRWTSRTGIDLPGESVIVTARR
jgi:ubiquinone/menaquinone biosynthesis C-methylase UbiE